MAKMKLLADSSFDMPKELIESCNIDVVPLTVIADDKEYMDYYDLSPEDFLNLLYTSKELPRTAQVNPQEFLTHFEKWQDDYDDILVVTLSSNGSGTYNSAVMAKKEYEQKEHRAKIHLIDSLCCSIGVALVAFTTDKLMQLGLGAEEIAKKMREKVNYLGSYLIPETLEYLRKGGRVNTVTAVLGSMLDIRPIISVVEGWGRNVGKVRGEKNVEAKLLDIFKEKRDDSEKDVFISHCGAGERAKSLKEKLLEIDEKLKIVVGHMGGTMTIHAGPGTLGLFFYEKDRRW